MKYLEAFFWGVMAALVALTLETAFSVFFATSTEPAAILPANPFSLAVFLALGALIEETVRYLILWRRIIPTNRFSHPFLHATIAGAGFMAVEIFASLGTVFSSLSIESMIGVALLHGWASLFMTANILFYPHSSFLASSVILGTSALFHFSYNAGIAFAGVFPPTFPFVLLGTAVILLFIACFPEREPLAP